MITEHITIQNKLGLHTRAAAKLVAVASRFESKIEIQHRDEIANCKSIMAIIVLGLAKNARIELNITGADELEARNAIVALIDGYFGEAQ